MSAFSILNQRLRLNRKASKADSQQRKGCAASRGRTVLHGEGAGQHASCIWPEVGSRMMQRLVTGTDLKADGWIEVQPGRYRFHASVENGVDVRIVIHEYLACHIQWEY